MKIKYLSLGMVLWLVLGSLLSAYPAKADFMEWPPDPGGFWNEPADPSIFDEVAFGLYGSPPPQWECLWDFGDGTIRQVQCWDVQYKQYNQDGDYSVAVLVTNPNGGQEWFGRSVSVRTHDVAITKFTVPQSARAGQTRQITVNVRNSRYPENVQVELYKVTPSGLLWVGTLVQFVPVRSANRTTAFNYSYTFTAEDARVGKATFKAMAFTLDARDGWPGDNEAISLPTKVSR